MRGIILTALLAGLAVLIANVSMNRRDASLAPPPALPSAQANQVRISYPDDKPFELSLPDGRQERIHSLLNVRRRMHFGDFEWNDKGIPDGPVWVRIDLPAQTISVFRAGHEIGTAVILYGTDGHPTPIGLFHVLEKDKDHWSRTYDAPMSYMLRLTDDGVAIHASDVVKGYATHGCIGVPLAFARRLFDQVGTSDIVVISDNESRNSSDSQANILTNKIKVQG